MFGDALFGEDFPHDCYFNQIGKSCCQETELISVSCGSHSCLLLGVLPNYTAPKNRVSPLLLASMACRQLKPCDTQFLHIRLSETDMCAIRQPPFHTSQALFLQVFSQLGTLYSSVAMAFLKSLL